MKIGVFGNDRFLTRILSAIIAEDDHSMFHSRYWSVFEESAKKHSFSALIYMCEHAAQCSLPSMRCLKLSQSLHIPSILIHGNANKRLNPEINQDTFYHFVNNPFYPVELLSLLRHFAKYDANPKANQETRSPSPDQFFSEVHWLQEIELAPKMYYNRADHYVLRDGLRVFLSPREGRMLEILVQNEGRVVPFDELFHAIWKAEENGSYDSLYVVVRSLKKKLIWRVGEKNVDLIQNVYGTGYLMKIPVASSETCTYET